MSINNKYIIMILLKNKFFYGKGFRYESILFEAIYYYRIIITQPIFFII